MKKIILLAMFSVCANAATVDCSTYVKDETSTRYLISHANVGNKSGVVVTDYGTDPFNPAQSHHMFVEMTNQEIVGKIDKGAVLQNNTMMYTFEANEFNSFARCVGAK